jgi:hypothetical protein
MLLSNIYMWDLIESLSWVDTQHTPKDRQVFSAYSLLNRLTDHEVTGLTKFYAARIAELDSLWRKPTKTQRASQTLAEATQDFAKLELFGHVIGLGEDHFNAVLSDPSILFAQGHSDYTAGFSALLLPPNHRIHLNGGYYTQESPKLFARLDIPELLDGGLGRDTALHALQLCATLSKFFAGTRPDVTKADIEACQRAQDHINLISANTQGPDYVGFLQLYRDLGLPYMLVNGGSEPHFLISNNFEAVPLQLTFPAIAQTAVLSWLEAHAPALIESTPQGFKITTPECEEFQGETIVLALLPHLIS